MPRKRKNAGIEILDSFLNSPFASTFDDKLRQVLGLPLKVKVVDEKLKRQAQEAGEKIRKRMKEDYRCYKILGVDPSAEEEVVKSAYKAKARLFHPDHTGSDKRMAEINQAYEDICKLRGWSR